MKKILMALLLTIQPALSAELNIEVKPPFVELEERMQMSLTDEFVDALRPFARNLGRRLDGILTHASELPSLEAEEFLVNSVKRMVYEGDIKYDEMLSREILERAILIHKVLLDETDSNDFGIVDMRIRLVTRAIELARDKYAGLDLAFFDKKEDVAYADFGKEYMQYLLELNKSVFDATAQYKLQKLALQFYQYDLSRDINYESYATDIVEIHDSLPSFPVESTSDQSALRYIRGLRSLVATLGMSLSNNSSYRAPRRVRTEDVYNPIAGLSSSEQTVNSDNSVTIEWPKTVRGDSEYFLSWEGSNSESVRKWTNVCQAFGFDSYLKLSGKFKGNSGAKRIELNEKGEFVQFLYDYNPIQEVTCYNNDTLIDTVIKHGETKVNLDNSVTFEWPKIERGGKEFFLSWQGSSSESTQKWNNICRALGYDSYLEGTGRFKSYSGGKRAELHSNGKFDQFLYDYNPVEKVTCINE